MSSRNFPQAKFEVIKGYHNVTKLLYHLVLVNKYRKQVYSAEMVQEAIKEVAEENNIKILEINVGELDHVHILIQVSPKQPMSTVVAILKAKSSSLLKEMPEWRGWSKGFYLSTVGTNDLTEVENYIRNQ